MIRTYMHMHHPSLTRTKDAVFGLEIGDLCPLDVQGPHIIGQSNALLIILHIRFKA